MGWYERGLEKRSSLDGWSTKLIVTVQKKKKKGKKECVSLELYKEEPLPRSYTDKTIAFRVSDKKKQLDIWGSCFDRLTPYPITWKI